MKLRHGKQQQTYVTNLNDALQALHEAIDSNDIIQQTALHPAIKFNGGGHQAFAILAEPHPGKLCKYKYKC
jgi:superoxide dismutase, Fe-Mn family